MNREEYLRRLSYLLQDLPEEEYKDALEYYEDYFEEAGPDREQEVIRELGRPERIAAMIRDSVKEKDGDWEYTENGYYNKRYDDHNQMPGQTEKKMKEIESFIESNLSGLERYAVWLRYIDDLSNKEISMRLGYSSSYSHQFIKKSIIKLASQSKVLQ